MTSLFIHAALGALNRPFAAPGETVEVRLRPCDTSSTAMPAMNTDGSRSIA